MDPIRRSDVEEMRRASPAEKARLALDLMRTGIDLKRAGLRARYPNETDDQIDARLQAWLDADDGD